MFSVPTPVIEATTSDRFDVYRSRASSYRSDSVKISNEALTDEVIAELLEASEKAEDKGFSRVLASIQKARSGDFPSIPRISAAPEIIRAYLQHEIIDGWVYVTEADGYLHPYLVTSISLKDDRDGGVTLAIRLVADDPNGKHPRAERTLTYDPSDVTRKKPYDLLLAQKAYKETAELRAEYTARRERFEEVVSGGFAKQYRFSGVSTSCDYRAGTGIRDNVKVIHDLAPNEVAALREVAPSTLFAGDDDGDGVGSVPVKTAIPVFDLLAHSYVTVNTADLTDYKYDKSLRHKIILPEEQRELLDILTSDIETFTSDIIEGKSAGNTILSKGVPGVGKTLTAEVYSELIERPLYSIHSGILGITADKIRENLESVFQRAKRWNVVLLIDEADVFVMERGSSINQNAIVAEFLRTLEYFDGLLFMTTNRSGSIDDAIESRTAAMIDYKVPGKDDARLIWKVQAENNGIEIADELLDDLVDGFVDIRPRDIKMLLRLALRVAAKRETPLSIEVFAQCALFRGLHYSKGGAAE